MPSIFKKIKKHKVITFILIAALITGGYFVYKALKPQSSTMSYVTAKAEKGALVASVGGTGQVAVSNQVDLKAKASGDLVRITIKQGQEIKAGSLVAQLNATEAEKSIRDALANLESARLSLEKLMQPAAQLSLMQAENALTSSQEAKDNAQEDLDKAYEDGFNAVANVFLDMPAVMTGLQDVLYGTNSSLGGAGQKNIDYFADSIKSFYEIILKYKADAADTHQQARAKYELNFQDYKTSSRYDSNETVGALVNQSYETAKTMAEAVKNANSLLQFYKVKTMERGFTVPLIVDTYLTSLNSYTSKTNSHLVNLLSVKNTIKNDKDAIISAERSILEKTVSLANLKSGADALDIKSQQLSIKQKENALADIKEKLKDYYIYAPFDGVVAAVNNVAGDAVSANAAVATLITKQKLAEISLNEVDASKVKLNQKATLTFDAVEGLTLTGEVAEIDTLGTVTQGVVNYNVQIVLDTQDDRVKPGMTVSASIITEAKQGVLLVPNAAVKSATDGSYYVEMVDNNAGVKSARRVTVEIGLANDSSTEIISGLSEGQEVIERTVDSAKTSTIQSTNSGPNNRGAQGGFMIPR